MYEGLQQESIYYSNMALYQQSNTKYFILTQHHLTMSLNSRLWNVARFLKHLIYVLCSMSSRSLGNKIVRKSDYKGLQYMDWMCGAYVVLKLVINWYKNSLFLCLLLTSFSWHQCSSNMLPAVAPTAKCDNQTDEQIQDLFIWFYATWLSAGDIVKVMSII